MDEQNTRRRYRANKKWRGEVDYTTRKFGLESLDRDQLIHMIHDLDTVIHSRLEEIEGLKAKRDIGSHK